MRLAMMLVAACVVFALGCNAQRQPVRPEVVVELQVAKITPFSDVAEIIKVLTQEQLALVEVAEISPQETAALAGVGYDPSKPFIRATVRATGKTPYSDVVAVVNALRDGNVNKIAIDVLPAASGSTQKP